MAAEKVKNDHGITLVEVIVSLALLAVLLVMMSSVFMSGIHYLYYTTEKAKKSDSAAGKIEKNDSSLSRSSGSFEIDFGGTAVTVSGEYRNNSQGGVGYNDFVPAS